MQSRSHTRIPAPVVGALIITAITLPAGTASAYVGPGAGLSAIGIVFALIATVLLALVGFVWYPAKRIFRQIAGRHEATPRPAPNANTHGRNDPPQAS